jgi:YD repeat-containing protein
MGRAVSKRRVVASVVSVALVAAGLVGVSFPAAADESAIWVPEPFWPAPEDPAVPSEAWVPPADDRVLSGEDASRAPSGTTAGAPGLGELPWFTFQEFALSGDTVARVNVANGNLLVTTNDSRVAAPGFGLRADRFYNGLSTENGAFGGGWSSSASAIDIGLDITSTTVTFHGPNGIESTFTEVGTTGTYDRPAGLNATLTQVASSGSSAWELVFDRTGEKWLFAIGGNPHRFVDRNGVGVTFVYSGSEVVELSHDNGRGIQFDVNSGVIDELEDSPGRTVQFDYDSSGRLEHVTSADGQILSYTYDSTGRLSTIELPSAAAASITVTFGYDSSHRVTTVTQETVSPTWGSTTDTVTTFTYLSGETEVVDANSHTSSFELDAEGRVTKTIDALGNEREQTWTANSDVATTVDALTAANTTSYTYDGNANVTAAQLPTGAAASAVYTTGTGCSSSGGTAFQVKCTTDASGNTNQVDYDAAGNQVRNTNVTAGAVEFEYTYEDSSGTICGGLAGQICSAEDGNGNVTSYGYDSFGDLILVTPPAPLGSTSYDHDALGRIIEVIDGNGDITEYGYDNRDRSVFTEYDNAATVSTSYSTTGWWTPSPMRACRPPTSTTPRGGSPSRPVPVRGSPWRQATTRSATC